MGSLLSTPKAPEPQVVFVPQPTPPPPPQEPEQNPTPDVSEETKSERKKTLLSRERGRFGTIATSFQGILQEANAGGRKTLLGE